MINDKLANEVVSFVAGGPVLQPVQVPLDRFPYRVESFEEALSIARLEEGVIAEPNYQSLPAVFLQNELRIREHVYGRSDWREISRLEYLAFAEFERAVERVPELYRDATDDVLAHLSLCWLSRLVIGRDPFFERIFEAYELGLWPCGWIDAGELSDLVVFAPA